MRRSGVFIGTDLNPSLDNLWFTLLFRRPEWRRRHAESGGAAIRRGLGIFAAAMGGKLRPSVGTLRFLGEAVATRARSGEPHLSGWRWSLRRALHMLASKGPDSSAHAWGWKAPITHVYLPTAIEHFPEMRYVHVIRHGLDMAYSQNQAQANMWAGTLERDADYAQGSPLQLSLRYWYVANRRAIREGQRLGSRFLLVNFDELCRDPATGVERLLAFVDPSSRTAQVDELAALVEPPDSIGRYRELGTRAFSDRDLERVRELGFTVMG